MADLRYRTVHQDLIEALPELADPYRRLFEDWDNFGNEPPGQYIVFSGTLGTLLQVVLSLREGTVGRDGVLRRALEFGELMLGSDDAAVHDLGIDAVAETLDGHPAGRATVEHLGGPRLRAWFSAYSTSDWARPSPDEIIDLWGVRAAVAGFFPNTPPHELPGISYPSSSDELMTLDAAQAAPDGAVLLSAYGTTNLYAVFRAREVATEEATLNELASQLAALSGDLPKGEPAAHFRHIPRGERVWNMHRGDAEHDRFWNEPWVADGLHKQRKKIAKVVRGERESL